MSLEPSPASMEEPPDLDVNPTAYGDYGNEV